MSIFSDNKNPLLTLLSVSLLVSCALSASQVTAGNLTVGLGAGYSDAEYEGVDSEGGATPVIDYEIGRFSFYFGGASVRIASFSSAPETDPNTGNQESSYNLHLFAAANLADEERENNDSPVFAGMETRDYGSSAGVNAVLETPFGLFTASHLVDVSDSSDGSLTTLAYGLPLYTTSRFFVYGSIGANIFDDNWNDYYYGVRESEATDSRASYQAGRSINPFIDVSASYGINNHWSISQGATLTFLDDTVIDSPLTVDDDTLAEYMINVLYTF